MLTGVIFGLGFSEIVLILVAAVLIMGPERIKTIKPFLKVVYKNYIKFMREVDAMQGEMTDMKETIMEPIKEVEQEAQQELASVRTEMSEGVESAQEIKKGLRALVDQSKKNMEQAREEAALEKKNPKSNPQATSQRRLNAAHMARGGHVGLLGKQGPGSSRRPMPGAMRQGQTAGQRAGPQFMVRQQGSRPRRHVSGQAGQYPAMQRQMQARGRMGRQPLGQAQAEQKQPPAMAPEPDKKVQVEAPVYVDSKRAKPKVEKPITTRPKKRAKPALKKKAEKPKKKSGAAKKKPKKAAKGKKGRKKGR